MKLFFNPFLTLLVWAIWYNWTAPGSLQILIQHWQVVLTMTFGSFIAGATSEGGGAIAFPVFTKVLQVAPHDAKIFSLAIQSVGMTAASLTILVLRVRLEKRVIFWASLGGIPGIILGSGMLAPLLSAAMVKMSFTAMVSSFAVTLAIINWKQRGYNEELQVFALQEKIIMLLAGFSGGIMSGLVGNGIDIICFSVMVLLFRVSEKIATPTSVVLMAANAMVGFILHGIFIGDFTPLMQNYWLAAVPVVIIGAPLGAYCCSKLNSRTIASLLIGLIVIEFLTSVWIIEFNSSLVINSIAFGLLFSGLYFLMSKSSKYCVS
jgi:uncharacterized membrane protein YfcA